MRCTRVLSGDTYTGSGYIAHDIRFEKVPSGQGSGEQWVRERYAASVMEYRARALRAATALVVVIDADSEEVDRRVKQLAEAVPRAENERIVHFIPKRHIETWILCLNDQTVDELTGYKGKLTDTDSQTKLAAGILFEWTRRNAVLPSNCLPSLRRGVLEAGRLEQK